MAYRKEAYCLRSYTTYTPTINLFLTTRDCSYTRTTQRLPLKGQVLTSRKLADALRELARYYDANQLKPNPSNIQLCAFHLRNRDSGVELDVIWRESRLQHCPTPRYLGVTLDRTLSFKQHCLNTKVKVCSRNNIIRKLTSYTWGAQPSTLRTSTLALSISATEYAAPIWNASVHARQVDIAVNETMRIVTGCLRPTPTEKIYPLAGVAPPRIRREVAANIERTKQENDPRHPLNGHVHLDRRLSPERALWQERRPSMFHKKRAE